MGSVLMTESLDSLSIGGLELFQAVKGYRFSLDPILLARFTRVKNQSKIVDLGTGSGVLPLILATISDVRQCVGLEIQESLYHRAQRNVEHNQLENKVRIVQGDVRDIRSLFSGGTTDLVVSNPPFRAPENGRVSAGYERATARHELFGGLKDFVAAAGWLLKNGGNFTMIHLAERLPQILTLMQGVGLEPKRLRLVHPHSGDPARLVLVEGTKYARPGLAVEAPLFVYDSGGEGRNYSAEVLAMYRYP
jgi:tRNA1Val (adenine37-N6)-methyltransferase